MKNMPKAFRYGLIIMAIAMILYLAARNFDDVIYFISSVFFEAQVQEEAPEDVFRLPTGHEGPENEAIN